MSLIAEDIHVSYGRREALRGVSLTAQPGEVKGRQRRLGQPRQLEEHRVGAAKRLPRMAQDLPGEDVGMRRVHDDEAAQQRR